MRKRDGLWIAGAVLLLDRVTKAWAAGLPAEGLLLIPGVVRLRLTLNDGAAFSLLGGNPRLLGLVSLAVIAAATFFLRGKRFGALATAGLMMMLGGALGNLWDRLGAGLVPDWIELLFVRFAVFNAADACLTVGCALVMGCLLFTKEGSEQDQPERMKEKDPAEGIPEEGSAGSGKGTERWKKNGLKR